MAKRKLQVTSTLLVLGMLLAGLPAQRVRAATTLTVESSGDGPANATNCPGSGCRLRDAIAAAGSGDVIQFSVTGTISLTAGQLVISGTTLTIQGPGPTHLTINGSGAGRILDVENSMVSLSGLTLTNGAATTLTYVNTWVGGAILSRAGSQLNLDQMVVENSSVDCASSCAAATDGAGGGISSLDNTSLNISNSTITSNSAEYTGGGIYYDAGTASGDDLTLTNVAILSNQLTHSTGLGGGGAQISSAELATITGSTVTGNLGDTNPGAGIGAASPLSILTSTFTGNQTSGNGGAIWFGGSSLVLENSTFLANSASVGGAIFTGQGTSAITNSTFDGNTAVLGGGGIMSQGSSGLDMQNDTLSGNQSGDSRGGAILTEGAAASIQNTIMANSPFSSDCYSTISWGASFGNLIEINDAGNLCPSPAVTSDPLLAAIGNYGGPTATMALIAGSPAIDHGNNAVCLADDQRGRPRPVDGDHNGTIVCDIGAYERQPVNFPAALGGNDTTNVGVFRPSSGGWFVKSVLGTTFGLNGDDPIPFDFNGDGVSDVAVFRPSNASWYVQGQFSTFYGVAGDVPVPGDYDGNGTADLAVYRPTTSAWYVKNQFSTIFGLPGDIPVPGDYNGDGITDVAVFRPSTGAWYVRGQFAAIFGLTGDIPVPGDYNGDGVTDLAVFRPSTSAWYVRSQFSTIYGVSGDIPVPGDYDGNGTMDVAVFRPSTRGWFVRNQSSTIYGLTGDYPLPAPDTNADGNPYQ